MKKLFFALLATAFLFACNKDDDGIELQDHDANRMMTLMHQMMSRMDTVPVANDPEIDFARMMRVHQQGAIDMANLELQEGKNDSLKRVAQKIINEQQSEIQQLSAILLTLVKDNTDMEFTMEHHEGMMKMGKNADVQLITGDIDNDFATLMIVHHEAAIDNASAYLHHGNNILLKAMANHMVETQTKEIQEMADWLKANKR
ncbi:DUF305 domain-containing protein [Paraflavisolibacter sp. H34]|uniref:DUF305 domain-containing protein n=1 Tax=Huijunlia imazamoxiresistens TaxID=3127457 RepID=UPI003016A51C